MGVQNYESRALSRGSKEAGGGFPVSNDQRIDLVSWFSVKSCTFTGEKILSCTDNTNKIPNEVYLLCQLLKFRNLELILLISVDLLKNYILKLAFQSYYYRLYRQIYLLDPNLLSITQEKRGELVANRKESCIFVEKFELYLNSPSVRLN